MTAEPDKQFAERLINIQHGPGDAISFWALNAKDLARRLLARCEADEAKPKDELREKVTRLIPERRGDYDISRLQDALIVRDADTGVRAAMFLDEGSSAISIAVDTSIGSARCYSVPFDVLVKILRAGPAAMRSRAEGVPERILEIARLIATQNNRATDQPLFAVQQRRRHFGIDTDYGGNISWIDVEGYEADTQKSNELEESYEETREEPDGWYRTGYLDTWEFVTACFTEQGCKDYIARDGHNLKEPRIYAYGTYRNAEYQEVRDWLLSLAAAPSPGEKE